MVKLDLKDRKILYELDRNARQSNSEIAKKVRLNKNTVNFRINRMEKEKVILGYYTVIDNSKLGYFSFRVYLKYFNTKAEDEKRIVDWLKDHKKVGVLGKIETVYDLAFHVLVKNIYEFDEFWLEFKKKFREYFWNEKVHVFSSVYHFKRRYLLKEIQEYQKEISEYEFIGKAMEKPIKHDTLDLNILKLISKNARMPVIEMSKKLKIPERTVAFRIKQLEKNKIILGYRVNLNLEKIGYEYYKINIILNDFQKYGELLNFAKPHVNIIYIDRTLTELDFEIDVEIENRKELLKLLDEIKISFNVRDMELLLYKEYYKIELVPQ